jgi:hypothetical protein
MSFKYKIGDRGICYTMRNRVSTFTVEAGPFSGAIIFKWDDGVISSHMSKDSIWDDSLWGILEEGRKITKEFPISKFINSINKGEYSGRKQ